MILSNDCKFTEQRTAMLIVNLMKFRNKSKFKPGLLVILFIFAIAPDLGRAVVHSKKILRKSHSTKHSLNSSQVDSIVVNLISEIEARPLRIQTNVESSEKQTLSAEPNKASWLQQLYLANLVEASKITALLSDKLLQNRVFEHYLLSQSEHFLLHTIGLKEFLLKHHLVDSENKLIPNTDTFEEALALEFPNGFIVRPALGVAPLERNHGLFATSDDFLKEIFRPRNSLYHSSTLYRKIKSHIINAVASGEAIVLQEDFAKAFQSKQHLKSKFYERVRIHTFENKVVKNAVPKLWVNKRNFEVGEDQIEKLENFVQEFLDALPNSLTTRQAWSLDVALLDNGEIKILDVVTNRGLKSSWTSYLDEPKIIGAYTRHLHSHLDIEFSGWSGILFRSNLANYANYWQLKKNRTSRIGSSQIMSSLPPWPF